MPQRSRDAFGRPVPLGDAAAVDAVDESPRPPHETLAEARRLLAQGRAFSAHEILESRWKSCPAAERDLWQGLAQLCVGVTHGQRGNTVGAERLLLRGAGRLGAYAGPAYGLPLTELIAFADAGARAAAVDLAVLLRPH